jgi:hypothetical protein
MRRTAGIRLRPAAGAARGPDRNADSALSLRILPREMFRMRLDGSNRESIAAKTAYAALLDVTL